MGKQNNRTCIICGKQYHYCPNCGEDVGKPTWYFIFDGENCHDIYDVCTKYRDNEIDAKSAYEIISKLDISDIKDFAESTRLQIEEIIKLNTKTSAKVDTKTVKNETSNEQIKDTNNTKYNKK